MRRFLQLALCTYVLSTLPRGVIGFASAQPGPQGPGNIDPAFQKDRSLFHYLLSHRKEIRRQVKKLENGVRTATESDNPQVATRIQEYVANMYKRIEGKHPIHRRDPLFTEVLRHADKIEMKIEKTTEDVKVTETSTDHYVARLIQAHANVVSKFIANGHSEVRKKHPVPKH